jgi:hypothetical protein
MSILSKKLSMEKKILKYGPPINPYKMQTMPEKEGM